MIAVSKNATGSKELILFNDAIEFEKWKRENDLNGYRLKVRNIDEKILVEVRR